MIGALSTMQIVRFVVVVTLAMGTVWFLLGYVSDAESVWKLRAVVVPALNGLVLLLAWRPALHALHKWTWGDKWWFPWLDGKWTAEICSNWPRVRRMMESAKSEDAPRFDTLSEPVDENDVTWADVEIKSGLLEIEMVLRPRGSSRTSRTLFVKPEWCKPRLPQLHYSYEQTDLGTIAPTDARRHFGAAHLTYDPDKDVLVGEYWTERMGERGLNTSGTIRLTRHMPSDDN